MRLSRGEWAGLAALALAGAAPLAWLEPALALPVWAVGLPMLAALAVMAWRSERWPATAGGALRLALAFALAGAGVAVAGALLTRWREPGLTWIDALLQAGPLLALALALCPGLTAIAAAGALRNRLERRQPADSASSIT